MMTIPRAAILVLACCPVAGAPVVAQEPAAVTWHDGPFADALAAATSSKRPVLVYFWMDGSTHCEDLWGKTLTAKEATPHLSAFVCHSAKATTPVGRGLIQRYGVKTLPTLLVITADGVVDDAMLGFVPPVAFDTEMRRILSGSQTLTALRSAASAAPDDLDQRFALAQKLTFVGDSQAGTAILNSIRRDDPEGETAAGAELLLFDIRQAILAAAADANDTTTWDLRPMYERLRKTRQTTVLFKGFVWVADIEGRRGDRVKQRAAWRSAWPHVPATQASEWIGDILLGYWNQRDDALLAKDRKMARAMASKLLQEVDGDAQLAGGVKLRAFQLRCAACGLAVVGKLRDARKAIDRACALLPDDPEMLALAQQLHQ